MVNSDYPQSTKIITNAIKPTKTEEKNCFSQKNSGHTQITKSFRPLLGIKVYLSKGEVWYMYGLKERNQGHGPV